MIDREMAQYSLTDLGAERGAAPWRVGEALTDAAASLPRARCSAAAAASRRSMSTGHSGEADREELLRSARAASLAARRDSWERLLTQVLQRSDRFRQGRRKVSPQ